MPTFSNWSRQFNNLIPGLKEISGETGKALQAAQTRLESREVTLVFGGHFSAGKSCLINAAIKTPLLPVDDLPETGALCLLSRGEKNGVTVHTRTSTQSIPCTTQAIRKVVTLVSEQSEYRTEVNEVDRLVIQLQGDRIPPSAIWIDSPGINDTQAMEERARQAAATGDILVWVINSRQPLSESEVDFIQAHQAKRGPDSVVFILNAFLPADTAEEWERYLSRNAARIHQMLGDRLEMVPPPPMLTVSARALTNPNERGFGRRELDALLAGLSHPEHPQVLRTRLYSIKNLLEDAEKELVDKIAAAQDAQERFKRDALSRRRAQEEKLHEFRRQLRAHFDSSCVDIKAEVQRKCNAIAATIQGATLSRDNTYADQLHEAWEEIIDDEIETLERVSDNIVHQTLRPIGLSYLSSSLFSEIKNLLEPVWTSVDVPQNTPEAKSSVAGTIAGGVVGAMFALNPFAIAIGAKIGNSIFSDDGVAEALEKDVQGAKSNLLTALRESTSSFDVYTSSARSKLVAAIDGLLPPLPEADDAVASKLTAQLTRVRELKTLPDISLKL